LDVRPSALAKATAGARLVTTLGFSVAIAFALSLQYLAQQFVWRNWPAEEVLEGWLVIFRDRLIVTVLMAAAINVTALAHRLVSERIGNWAPNGHQRGHTIVAT
jgi:hypothetical protein